MCWESLSELTRVKQYVTSRYYWDCFGGGCFIIAILGFYP